MSNRKLKICFWVEDVETSERLRLPGEDAETFQVVLNFDTAEVEAKIDETRQKLVGLSEDDLDKITRMLPIGWAREIVQTGSLTVMNAARLMILKHLGYRTPQEMLEADRTAAMAVGGPARTR